MVKTYDVGSMPFLGDFDKFLKKVKGGGQMVNESNGLDSQTKRKNVRDEFNNLTKDFEIITGKIEQ